MKRYTFQVNMHFGDREICAVAMTLLPNWPSPVLVPAPNLTTLLRRIKKNCGLKLEEIVLEFQPEN